MSQIKRYGIRMRPLSQIPHLAEMKKGEMVKYTDYMLLEKKTKSMITTSAHNRTVKAWMNDCSMYQSELTRLRAENAELKRELDEARADAVKNARAFYEIQSHHCSTCVRRDEPFSANSICSNVKMIKTGSREKMVTFILPTKPSKNTRC